MGKGMDHFTSSRGSHFAEAYLRSDGTGYPVTYGVREPEDVLSAVKFMREKKGFESIVLIGTSLGGSASLLAASRDPKITMVIAENPFESFHALVRVCLTLCSFSKVCVCF